MLSVFPAALALLGCTLSAHVERLPDATAPVPPLAAEVDPVLARGARLYRTASCVGCHSPPFADATHLGGGRDLPTMFGTFYAPNISPDPVHGIGTWTEDDFIRAMRDGRAPDGHRYWPTFPYMAYTNLDSADLHALWVYLQAQPPVDTPSRPHEVNPPYSTPGMLALWRGVAFRRGPLEPDPEQSAAWNRGRYLVEAVSYCDECHTPRTGLGLMRRKHYLAGGANPGKADVHPNLTPHPTAGIGTWSVDAIATYLKTGRKPDGTQTPADNIMAEKIMDSFAYYTDAERHDIAVYLASLPPDPFAPEDWGLVRRQRRREDRRARRLESSSPR